MRIQLRMNSFNFEIDSMDPELVAKWLVEMFARFGPMSAADYCQVQLWPSFSRDGGPDWIADSRVLGRLYPVANPRDVIRVMGQQLDELDGIKADESLRANVSDGNG